MNPVRSRHTAGAGQSRPGNADNPPWQTSRCIPKPKSGRAGSPILVDENGVVVESLHSSRRRTSSSASTQLTSSARRQPHLRDWPHPIGIPTRLRVAAMRANGEPIPTPPFTAPAATASRRRSAPAATASRSRGSAAAATASRGSHGRQPLDQRRAHPYTGPLRIINRAAARERQERGFQPVREGAFPEEEFYVGDARPEAESNSDNHQCCMCFNIKSHPVDYGCGHTDCFICVRRLAETSWHCPQCRAKMHSPPQPCEKTEAKIAADHPEWHDPSTVTYSWAGLRRATPIVVVEGQTTGSLFLDRVLGLCNFGPHIPPAPFCLFCQPDSLLLHFGLVCFCTVLGLELTKDGGLSDSGKARSATHPLGTKTPGIGPQLQPVIVTITGARYSRSFMGDHLLLKRQFFEPGSMTMKCIGDPIDISWNSVRLLEEATGMFYIEAVRFFQWWCIEFVDVLVCSMDGDCGDMLHEQHLLHPEKMTEGWEGYWEVSTPAEIRRKRPHYVMLAV
ncbi:hypothetical protein C8R43DRAFT_965689 [Mycena crocata]|nr:hypothetical protein C8R43DRAFT_965689 [Mycena crocata]